MRFRSRVHAMTLKEMLCDGIICAGQVCYIGCVFCSVQLFNRAHVVRKGSRVDHGDLTGEALYWMCAAIAVAACSLIIVARRPPAWRLMGCVASGHVMVFLAFEMAFAMAIPSFR